MPYLENLTRRLAAGATKLPEETRRLHGTYLADAQGDGGGFAGRKGSADPYYTGFGLGGLALLGRLDNGAADRAARFLAERLETELSGIDFISLVFGTVLLETVLLETVAGIDVFRQTGRDRGELVVRTLGPLGRDDGGHAKTSRAAGSSTYHTFLAAVCKQLVGVPLEQTERTVELIRSRRRDDGGFVEVSQASQSGTNPTAAAVGLLQILDVPGPAIRQDAARFLIGMQNAEGGFRANGRIPLADLLSTFTSLVTLADLDRLDAIDLNAARRYICSLGNPTGGFRGGAWDDAVDVEYTFYGLAALALLA